jgi:hypothetical protein
MQNLIKRAHEQITRIKGRDYAPNVHEIQSIINQGERHPTPQKHMNIYRINTTAFSEEDFLLLTTLTIQEITEVINPIVMSERNGESEEEYNNDSLVEALCNRYPNAIVQHHNEIERIIF